MNYNIVNKIIEINYNNKDKKYDEVKELSKKARKEYRQSDFRNDVIDEESFKTVCGRQWKKNLATLIPFVDMFKHISGREHIYEIPIPTTGELCEIYKSQVNVTRMVQLAKKIELLKVIDNTYQYNAWNDGDNHCKTYILNKNVQDLIIELCNKYSITHKTFIHNLNNNNLNNNIYNNNSIHLRELSEFNIKINSGLKLRIPLATDEQIIDYVKEIYPQIEDYQKLADEINEKYYTNDKYKFGIKFQPKVTRNKGGLITSISIRATNGICSYKEHDNGKNTCRIWRKDVLDEYFGKDNYMEYDVKSSIYRLTHFLNFNVWLDNSIDLYEEMYGQPFENEEQRRQYKLFAMKLYFDKSIGKLYTHTVRFAKEDYNKENIDEITLKMELLNMKSKMTDIIGEPFDSEIFLHESCIYMQLVNELFKLGFDVIQVYDGFYVRNRDDVNEEQFNDIVNDLLDTITLNYIKSYKI